MAGKKKCTFCDKKYSRQRDLDIHESEVHTGDRPYKCSTPHCEKSYRSFQELQRHMDVHLHPKVCLHCGLYFKTKATLKNHQKRLHPKTSTVVDAQNTGSGLRPTNAAVQSSSNQFTVTSNVSNGLRVKPIESLLAHKFGGLENRIPTTVPPPNTDQKNFNVPPNAGVILTRPQYYIIPPLHTLEDYVKEDGSCIVPDFTIGRKGYGKVHFSEPINIRGLNLDKIVRFWNREVIIYPDDVEKPPVGTELNRTATVTLELVWPFDKNNDPIKDKYRLDLMNYRRSV